MAVLFFIGAFLLGVLCADIRLRKEKPPIGRLRVDKSDPNDDPFIFLELYDSPERLEHGKYVILEVSRENYISQK